jgi:hypothetical protein
MKLTLPSKDEMFQLGELADALLKAQAALRDIAGARNLFGAKKDRETAQAVLAEIDGNPRLSGDRLKDLAEDFHAQRATMKKDPLVPVKLTVDEWREIRSMLGNVEPGDRTGLKGRIFFSGMANAELGGTRTVNLGIKDCKTVLKAIEDDIAHRYIKSSVRDLKQVLLRTLQDQIPAEMMAQMDAVASASTMGKRMAGASGAPVWGGDHPVKQKAADLVSTAWASWDQKFGTGIDVKFEMNGKTVACGILPVTKNVARVIVDGDSLFEIDRGNILHLSGKELNLSETEDLIDAISLRLESPRFGEQQDPGVRAAVASASTMGKRMVGASGAPVWGGDVKPFSSGMPEVAQSHLDGTMRESVRDRIQAEMAQSHLDGTLRESVKKDIPATPEPETKPTRFPDPQKQSYFGCSWDPPGEDGEGGFAP